MDFYRSGFLTKGETCELLRCSMASLDRLMHSKQIDFVKLGKERSAKVIFLAEDIKAFIEARKHRAKNLDSVSKIFQLSKKILKASDFLSGAFNGLKDEKYINSLNKKQQTKFMTAVRTLINQIRELKREIQRVEREEFLMDEGRHGAVSMQI